MRPCGHATKAARAAAQGLVAHPLVRSWNSASCRFIFLISAAVAPGSCPAGHSRAGGRWNCAHHGCALQAYGMDGPCASPAMQGSAKKLSASLAAWQQIQNNIRWQPTCHDGLGKLAVPLPLGNQLGVTPADHRPPASMPTKSGRWAGTHASATHANRGTQCRQAAGLLRLRG